MTASGLTAETILISGHKGDQVEAYLARPTGTTGPVPGIVVIHHAPGWDEWTREVCWKFAHRGIAAISPHLYSREGTGTPDELVARSRARGGVSDEQVVGDAVAAATYLRSQDFSNKKVAVIGF